MPDRDYSSLYPATPGSEQGFISAGRMNAAQGTVKLMTYVDADIAIQTLARADAKFRQQIRESARNRGRKAVSHLQTAAQAAYTRASTGRWARGIRFRTDETDSGASITIYAYNYPEGHFLTALGGGSFHGEPYEIRPRPGRTPLVDKFTKTKHLPNGVTVTTQETVTLPITLKIPKFGYSTWTPKGKRKEQLSYNIGSYRRMDSEERAAHRARRRRHGGADIVFLSSGEVWGEILGGEWAEEKTPFSVPLGTKGDRQRDFFLYPKFVKHPGWEEDVPARVVQEEARAWRDELIQMARVTWNGRKMQASGTSVRKG